MAARTHVSNQCNMRIESPTIGPSVFGLLNGAKIPGCIFLREEGGELLESRARSSPCQSLLFYPLGNTSIPTSTSYAQLLALATRNSRAIRTIGSFHEQKPILLHLDNHQDTIVWFWSVRLAKGLPVLSTPFSNVPEYRKKSIKGLSSLLESPICITRAGNVSLFDGLHHTLEMVTVEQLEESSKRGLSEQGFMLRQNGQGRAEDSLNSPAMLMLTSGSTGNAKAVCLTHGMVLASVAGKSGACALPPDRPFLNWIGLDHVGALVEIHLHALWENVDQIHVGTVDIVSSPLLFLDLLSRHRVSRSFAPNFFLASLVSASKRKLGQDNDGWDLSSLAFLVSGGEANDMQTCMEASALLESYGAPRSVIAPGFGMTETCAGCIYNTSCPDYDLERGYTVASLGTCINGMEMRVQVGVGTGPDSNRQRRNALPGEPGDLEVRGSMVFKSYYRNAAATEQAFTEDGWFRTGDRAVLDSGGHLCLAGRVKELVNINGVKTAVADIQLFLEQAVQGEEVVSRLVVFPSTSAHTEQVTVAYVPAKVEWETAENAVRIAEMDRSLTQACLLATSSRPLIFALTPGSMRLLPTTTLGKISRAKMRSLFEQDLFAADVARYRAVISSVHRKETLGNGQLTDMEAGILEDFASAHGSSGDASECGVDTPVWELGFTSMDLIRLKHAIDKRFNLSLPVIALMKNPTARALAVVIQDKLELDKGPKPNGTATPCQTTSTTTTTTTLPTTYDPVVIFRPPPPAQDPPPSPPPPPPLWLIHPGVGEVLVFIPLIHHLSLLPPNHHRAIYALRAPGFEPASAPFRFTSIAQAVALYVSAIKRHQPRGPYCLAGYSYGSMLAFEMAKVLQDDSGDSVQFLGVLNLPPRIKERMRYLNWNRCLINLAYFLGLVRDEQETELLDRRLGQHGAGGVTDKGRALEGVLEVADGERLAELGLSGGDLERWADVAYSLQSMAVDYEPKAGRVDGGMDVFYAVPLRAVAETKEVWLRDHLMGWREFVPLGEGGGGGVRFHSVEGAHYTMIGSEFVQGFAEVFARAMRERGV
ncbi:acyl-coenzyme A synthetases/AMP-acid ligase [Cercophora samala]|uniref:Acyl-coenzyme A synthetases/AMP-acid ligase n=1 Tax=Cercophora samala TaxID=330535 RepID=A0AA39Z897_9PEZI|nr:acyl-coenzyme A synthetases/AMP-acid ligase [Cercophora samala]